MVPFRFTGQSTLHFDEHGAIEPDAEFSVPDERVEAFLYRPDCECLDFDAAAEAVAMREYERAERRGELVAAEPAPAEEPAAEQQPQEDTAPPRRRRASKNDESESETQE